MLNIGLGLIDSLVEISKRAGDAIMKVYATDFTVDTKDDSSPVTDADKIAETLILRSIREGITDKFPIVSEEAAANGIVPNINRTAFWLVDPLDGTKEFVKHNDEFTVNIALIENTHPVLGIIHVPAKNITYWGSIHGARIQKGEQPAEPISCCPFPNNNIRALVSRSHKTTKIDKYLSNFSVTKIISAGSSLKFCLIAEGKADLYPRLGRTMEWDTAAGHAILKFAGGSVKTVEETELVYGKSNFENPQFIAAGPGLERKIEVT